MQYEIEHTWQARTAVESLDAGERAEVVKAIERLHQGPKPPGLPEVSALPGPSLDDKEIFVMRAGRGQRLHVVFTVRDEDRIVILDVISHHLVEEYRRSVAQ